MMTGSLRVGGNDEEMGEGLFLIFMGWSGVSLFLLLLTCLFLFVFSRKTHTGGKGGEGRVFSYVTIRMCHVHF